MHLKWLEGGHTHWLNVELEPYFGKRIGDKKKGFNAIAMILAPALGIALTFLYMIYSMLRCICCKPKNEEDETFDAKEKDD